MRIFRLDLSPGQNASLSKFDHISFTSATPFALRLDLAANFRQQRGLALELAGEGLNGPQGGGADVVLHPLDIVVDDLVVQAEEFEEIREQVVPMGDIAGQGFAGGGEDQAAVFFVFEEAFGIQALDHVGDAGLGNLEAGGDIDYARVPF